MSEKNDTHSNDIILFLFKRTLQKVYSTLSEKDDFSWFSSLREVKKLIVCQI